MAEMKDLDLGPCCCCRGFENVRTAIMLPLLAPVAGTGWGCAICGLPPDGAVAVLCDDCVDDGREPIYACAGYPAERLRCRVAALTRPFGHDMAKHPEEG